MAYRFMKTNQDRHTIKEMAGVLGASRSAYYSWARNGVSRRRAQADAELLPLVREIVTKHHRWYGSPRVRAELRSLHGKRASGKRAARLMRENSLNARGRKRFIPTTDSKHRLRRAKTYGKRRNQHRCAGNGGKESPS